MKRAYPPIKVLLALGLPALLILPGCEGGPADPVNPEIVPAFATNPQLPSVTGTTQMYVGGELRTLVVETRMMKDGRVDGFWMIRRRSTPFVQTYDAKCLIVEGNVAYIGGVWSDVPDKHAVFKVVDNGTGGSGPPDQETGTFSFGVGIDKLTSFCGDPHALLWCDQQGENCWTIDDRSLFNLEAGDIRVQGG